MIWWAFADGQQRVLNTPKILSLKIKESTPDTNRVKLQLQLAEYYVYKPGYFKIDKDTALVYLDQALALSTAIHSAKWRNETLLLKGDCYLQLDDIGRGGPFFYQVIAFYHQRNNKHEEAKVWERFGDSFTRNPRLQDQKIACYQQASALYRAINEKLNDIQVSKKIADVHMVQGKYDLAESELLQVIKDYKAVNFKELHYTYDLLASVNRLKGDLHQELFYKLEVVSSMESTGDYKAATYFYYNLAQTYYDLGFFDNSLAYYSKALPYSLKEKNYNRYYEILREIVKVLIIQGKSGEALKFLYSKTAAIPPLNFKQRDWMDAAFGSCYEKIKLYEKAEQYYLDMVKMADIDYKNQGFEDYLNNYSIVSNFYVATGQYKKAGFYLSKLLNAPPNLIRPSAMSQIQLMQFKTDSALGKSISAMKHYELYKKLNDSLFNATNKKLLEEVQLRYQSEKKDADLLLQSKDILLLKKQSQLEQNQVDRTRAIKNVILGGLFMAVVLLALSYNRYRLKQRKNMQLQEQQKIISDKNVALEKLLRDNEWLLKEVHHRVKNNLQVVMSLLTSQSAHLKDEVALNAVHDSRRRIQTMSLIHQKLYNSNSVSVIYMPEYINELVNYLKDSFEGSKAIYFDVHVAQVSLDVLQAVPVGLILNEAITNALKYAFPHTEEDSLVIRLTVIAADELLLSISDNGRGLPGDLNVNKPNSFGMKLMKGLTGDIGGTFDLTCDHGTTISVVFRKVLKVPQETDKLPDLPDN
ncbi:MAG: sensor histidine kinase [Bacteroidota bacterium]|nr:sensor histidine kinase [Bacteroidota bacterium]